MTKYTKFLVASIAFISSLPASAQGSFSEAIKDTDFNLNFRYRYESVEQDGFSRDADGQTLRSRLAAKTGQWNGWYAFGEIEDVRVTDNDFNSTRNGRTELPVIADPEQTELNQLYIGYANDTTEFHLGRRSINLENQRFIGSVAWRQNDQTYDSLSVRHQFDSGIKLDYLYFDNVNRIFGQDHPNPILANRKTDSHVIEASYENTLGRFKAYAHLLSFDDRPGESHRNLGARYVGQWGANPDNLLWRLELEYADQSDYDDGASIIDASYTKAKATVELDSRHFFALGYERLSGDGDYGFATPFATLHKHNGWADRFLTTPTDGLVEWRASYGGTWNQFKYDFIYLDFESDEGSFDLGTEFNWEVGYTFSEHFNLLLKYADYNADNFSVDTEILWALFEINLR